MERATIRESQIEAPALEAPADHSYLGTKGPPFWEEWRGEVPDEEIEFIRVIFEEFCSSWE